MSENATESPPKDNRNLIIGVIVVLALIAVVVLALIFTTRGSDQDTALIPSATEVVMEATATVTPEPEETEQATATVTEEAPAPANFALVEKNDCRHCAYEIFVP